MTKYSLAAISERLNQISLTLHAPVEKYLLINIPETTYSVPIFQIHTLDIDHYSCFFSAAKTIKDQRNL